MTKNRYGIFTSTILCWILLSGNFLEGRYLAWINSADCSLALINELGLTVYHEVDDGFLFPIDDRLYQELT